jgi:hypothetical protein
LSAQAQAIQKLLSLLDVGRVEQLLSVTAHVLLLVTVHRNFVVVLRNIATADIADDGSIIPSESTSSFTDPVVVFDDRLNSAGRRKLDPPLTCVT